ncbi:MAG: 2-hydroxychromene-2-carboxylate isomerase [Colwellia sp.]|nr:2-hydroxychromene-2-carboxylate isomerase [Colwellia sp.]
MTKSVDFYYDYISPASYLAWTQLLAICKRTNASINYKPMLLGGVLKGNNSISPIAIPAKWEWMKADLLRYAEYYSVPYQHNPHFIFNTVNPMRGAIWALATNQIEAYNQAMFTAAWVDGKDLSNKSILIDILDEAGINSTSAIEAMAHPEMKSALIKLTAGAVNRGIFGAPSMVVDDVMHFGQDRLTWVEQALSK